MNHNNQHEQHNDRLTISQINTNKSDTSTHDFLHGEKGKSHILALQEPSVDFQGMTRALPNYTTVYPTNHFRNFKENRTRSITMVSTRIPTGSWTQIPIESPDVTAIQMTGTFGTIRLFNIYSDGHHDDAINTIKKWTNTDDATNVPVQPLHTIWLGDFNRHHPMWDEPRNQHLFTNQNLEAAQRLITAITEHQLFMALPEHIPTLKSFVTGNYTRVDNVFCSKRILERIVKCDTIPHRQPTNTDHFPIETVIDIGIEVVDQRPRRNWKRVDWITFNNKLEEKLETVDRPTEIQSEEEFWARLKELDKIVEDVIDEEVPMMKPSPMQRRWWTEDLTKIRKIRDGLAAKSYRKRAQAGHPVHEEYRRARQTMSAEIKRAKTEKWVEFLTEADTTSIWAIGRMVEAGPIDGGRTRIPELIVKEGGTERVMRDNVDKVEAFKQAFFPPPPTSSNVPADPEYPPPAWNFSPPNQSSNHCSVPKDEEREGYAFRIFPK